MDPSLLRRAVARYVEAFATGDLAIIRDLYADDATVEDPVGSLPVTGLEAIVAFYARAFRSGMKLRLVGEPRCAGGSVAFAFEVETRHGTLSPIDVFDLDDDGKVRRMRAYWGPSDLR